MRPSDESSARLLVGNRLSELRRVAEWVHGWGRRHRLPAETMHRLDLCSTEVVTNIISHAYEDGGVEHQIALSLHRDGDVLRLVIEDDGRPFNPLEAVPLASATTVDDTRVGGWGILMVRRASDDLRYQRADGRNRLTVIQRCPTADPP